MGLERCRPEERGISSRAILNFLKKAEEEGHELHSFMLLKKGSVIAECWWEPYAPHYRHQLFSLSKSFTSMAVGIAVDEGLLTVDTPLSEIFKDELAALNKGIDEKIKTMRIKHLLTMNTGMEYENWGDNNIKGFLSAHIRHEPGTAFFYHTQATYMLSAAISRLTGQKLVDYLRPRLFEPLGIEPRWEEDNLGISFGGFGLNLKTEDIALFGQFLLQKGVWGGKRLVSEGWIADATAKQVSNGPGDGDWSSGYGYQFWRCKPAGVFRGDGKGGQFCIVIPEGESVIAITSNVDMGKLLDLIWKELLPHLSGGTAVPESAAYGELQAFCAGRSHLRRDGDGRPYPVFRGTWKVKPPTPEGYERWGIHTVHCDFENNEGLVLLYFGNGGEIACFVKEGEWNTGVSRWNGEAGKTYYRGTWKDGQVFSLCDWGCGRLKKITLDFAFNPDRTEFDLTMTQAGDAPLQTLRFA